MTVSGTGGTPAGEIMTTGGSGSENQKPDGYFCGVKHTEPGDEFVMRLKPRSGLPTLREIVFASSEDAPKPKHTGESHEANT